MSNLESLPGSRRQTGCKVMEALVGSRSIARLHFLKLRKYLPAGLGRHQSFDHRKDHLVLFPDVFRIKALDGLDGRYDLPFRAWLTCVIRPHIPRVATYSFTLTWQ